MALTSTPPQTYCDNQPHPDTVAEARAQPGISWGEVIRDEPFAVPSTLWWSSSPSPSSPWIGEETGRLAEYLLARYRDPGAPKAICGADVRVRFVDAILQGTCYGYCEEAIRKFCLGDTFGKDAEEIFAAFHEAMQQARTLFEDIKAGKVHYQPCV